MFNEMKFEKKYYRTVIYDAGYRDRSIFGGVSKFLPSVNGLSIFLANS